MVKRDPQLLVSNSKKTNKKAQVTTFIIIGIILLLSVSGLWYLRVREVNEEIEGEGIEIIEGALEEENIDELGDEWEEVYIGDPPSVPEYPAQQAPHQANNPAESSEEEEIIYCFDSDNGKYTSIKGFLNTESSNELYDHCHNDTAVVELFCEEDINKSEIFDCEAGCENGMCKCVNDTNCVEGYFCDEGYCKSKCQDYDMGKNYDIFGEVFVVVNSTENYTVNDSCKEDNITLNEQYCYFGEARTQEHECLYGCEDGRCIHCEDSDRGKMYFIKGNSSLGEEFVVDSCLNGTTLNESYCGAGEIFGEEYTCTRGCEDGKCLSCIELNDSELIFAGGVVNESQIQVNLWDNMYEDGDVVDIMFNGEYIDINYSLLNAGKIYSLNLSEGINKFTAIDVETPEGKMSWPPGKVLTAAAEILGGTGEQPSFYMMETGQRRTLLIYYGENATPRMINGSDEEDPLENVCMLVDLAEEENGGEEEELTLCLDTDVDESHPRGSNYEVAGSLGFVSDNCVNSSYLEEVSCDTEGNAVLNDNVYCSNGCINGACT